MAKLAKTKRGLGSVIFFNYYYYYYSARTQKCIKLQNISVSNKISSFELLPKSQFKKTNKQTNKKNNITVSRKI